MKLAPSLTWFFVAIAAVLVAGFAWLEFNQHGKALPDVAIASSWQPPKTRVAAPIDVTPPKGRKGLSMATSSRSAPAPKKLKDTMAKQQPVTPERNYDDIPAPDTDFVPEEVETTFAETEDSDGEINDSAEKVTPEKLIMKGFGNSTQEPADGANSDGTKSDVTKMPEQLQQEFDELSDEQGPLDPPPSQSQSPDGQVPDKAENPGGDKASEGNDQSPDEENTVPTSGHSSSSHTSSSHKGHGQDAGDGTETGETDPSSQRPPE